MRKCPKCDGPVKILVNLNVWIPGELESRLSKKALRRKDVEIWGASWEYATYMCLNQKTCCWNHSCLKTAMDKLREENEELKEKLNERTN